MPALQGSARGNRLRLQHLCLSPERKYVTVTATVTAWRDAAAAPGSAAACRRQAADSRAERPVVADIAPARPSRFPANAPFAATNGQATTARLFIPQQIAMF
jgi:hypothetical protein